MVCYPCTRCGGCEFGKVADMPAPGECPVCHFQNKTTVSKCDNCGAILPPQIPMQNNQKTDR